MASRGAQFTTGREEKQEKEKVRSISQEIVQKSLRVALNKPGPSQCVKHQQQKHIPA